MGNREYRAAIFAELERAQATDITYEEGGKHPRVVYTYNGKRQFYVIPASPSDNHRGILNMRADIRRILGLKPEPKAPAAKRAVRKRAPILAASMPDDFAVRADPFDALKAWKPPPRFTWAALTGRSWIVTYIGPVP